MYLVQILLPVFDNEKRVLPESVFRNARDRLSSRHGGLTAFTRAPAQGEWTDGGETRRDDIVVFEVMADALDEAWWREYKRTLEVMFRQKEIVIRAHLIELL